MPAPPGDVVEIDEVCVRFSEVCVRFSPGLWLWVAVSRLTGQVLGFALGDRSDGALAQCWAQVPEDYRGKPVRSDHWGAYARFFPAGQHWACDKGSGETSHAEAWNTKWRQRQSGLVRRACGVSARISQDVRERFLILAAQHNEERARRWEAQRIRAATATH